MGRERELQYMSMKSCGCQERRKRKKKVSKKPFVIGGLLVTGLVIVGARTFIKNAEATIVVNKSFEGVMSDVGENSSIDEVLAEIGPSMEEIKTVEIAMEQAKLFDALEMDKHLDTLQIEVEQMEYNPEQIQDIYEEAKELDKEIDGKYDILSKQTNQFYESASRFLGAEDAVNSYLADSGYQIYSKLGKAVACSKVIDTCGLSPEVANHMQLQSIEKMGDDINICYTQPDSKKRFEIKSSHCILVEDTAYKMVSTVYKLQTETTEVKGLSMQEKAAYNPDRVALLEESKNILYGACYSDYSLKRGNKLQCDTSNKELKKVLSSSNQKKK